MGRYIIGVEGGSGVANELGWEQYNDSNTTALTGQTLLNGVPTALTIDGASSITSQAPANSTGLWDTATNDIGGLQGIILSDSVSLLKGGVAQTIMRPLPIYTLGTFLANGGNLLLTYNGTGTCDIYGASVLIIRTTVGI